MFLRIIFVKLTVKLNQSALFKSCVYTDRLAGWSKKKKIGIINFVKNKCSSCATKRKKNKQTEKNKEQKTPQV